ncbi:MAG: DUF4147 domain-containing protein, partial [Planctomycetota bacterium]
IWTAGVDAVKPSQLIEQQLSLTVDAEGRSSLRCRPAAGLTSSEVRVPLPADARVFVFGAGKAGAAMALAVETILLRDGLAPARLDGWVNVPEGFSERPHHIHLHPARPLGRNEPTEEVVRGTGEILARLERLRPQDVGICLISGGGSALLCAPVTGVSWEDKLLTTRLLSSRGASIRQLNCVRTQLSTVKGGGLARRFSGSSLLTLVLSDVLGDPVETIASGPTVPRPRADAEALQILREVDPSLYEVPASVVAYLSRKHHQTPASGSARRFLHLLGNNDVATAAAAASAEQRGYQTRRLPVDPHEGVVEDTARQLLDELDAMRAEGGRRCLISGGEPVVSLVDESQRGLGGRNQQLVLTALLDAWARRRDLPGRFALLSAGTDGEDGPTDAAGAWFTDRSLKPLNMEIAEIRSFQTRNDAYHFFESAGGLFKTGGTGTNVCDLRVLLTVD